MEVAPQPTIVERLVEWELLAGPSPLIEPGFDFDGRTLLFLEGRGWQWGANILTSTGATPASVYTTPRLWLIHTPRVEASRLVFVEHDGDAGQFNLKAIPLGEGKPITIASWNGTGPSQRIPQFTLEGDSVLWLRDGPASDCLMKTDLRSEVTTERWCTSDADLLRLHADRNHVTVVAADSNAGGCNRLLYMDADAAPEVQPEQMLGPGCSVFDGVSNGRMAIWTTGPDQADILDFFDVRVQGYDGETTLNLGRAVAGSAMLCGEQFYWLSRLDGFDEIRTWSGTEVATLYRGPDLGRGAGYVTTAPQCNNNIVTIARASGAPGAPDEILAYGEFEWAGPVNPEDPGFPHTDARLLVESVRAELSLDEWSAQWTDDALIAFAEATCKAIPSYPDPFQMLDQQATWAEDHPPLSLNQYAAWIQLATFSMCPEYYIWSVPS